MEGAELSRERIRSPNYPAFGLSTAIERALALYKRDGKAAVHTSQAVRAWGYNSLNGRSLSAIGALRQFGLLEDATTKMVKLSQTALTILLAPPSSPDRMRALSDAARRPKIFSDLFEQYQDGYPSTETMVANLTLSSNFSEEAASKVIAAFRETTDLLEQQNVDHTSSDAGTADDGRMTVVTSDSKPKRKETIMPESGREAMDIPIPIVSGGQAILRLPRRMSETDFTAFKAVLDAVLTGMRTALTAPPPELPGSEAP